MASAGGEVISCHTVDAWNEVLQKGNESKKLVISIYFEQFSSIFSLYLMVFFLRFSVVLSLLCKLVFPCDNNGLCSSLCGFISISCVYIWFYRSDF